MKAVYGSFLLLGAMSPGFANVLGWTATASASATLGSQTVTQTNSSHASALIGSGLDAASADAWISITPPGLISWDVAASASGCAYGPCTLGVASVSASFFDEIILTGGSGAVDLNWTYSPLPSSAIIDLPSQVTYGVPFDVSISFSETVTEGSLGDPEGFGTFGLSGLVVDGSPQYTFQSASGETDGLSLNGFQGTIVAAPEPAGWLLAVVGLLAGLGFLRVKSAYSASPR